MKEQIKKIINIFFPKETERRVVLIKNYYLIKSFFIKIIKNNLGIIFIYKDSFLKNKKTRNNRKINLKSKKIIYIGHSYHNKTKSTSFLIDYLKEFFDVEIILDESWNGKPFPDLSFIDESYLCVIFFQNLPNTEIVKKIKNNNIIFFPMYDGVRYDYGFWRGIKGLKIINFSNTLHKKIKNWGLDSLYVQYFPSPNAFIPGDKKGIFFWQRLTYININTISSLFNKGNFKIHLHKAVDPGQEFIQPIKLIEDKFNITYSDWFETKEEMLSLIKEKGIYIAPREYEGIGMSFLEAMAMGKAVVSVDNPTMNEYIKDGENGYLFDLKHPKEIDLSSIEQVQRNTYKYMQDGFKKWEKEKIKIIDFIRKE